MQVTLETDTDAFELLSHDGFLGQWQELYDQCPWATIFQSVKYLTSWYNAYQSSHKPLIFCAYEDDGQELVGFLPLASKNGLISPASFPQGEYHGWLSEPEITGEFMEEALAEISCYQERFSFRWLPPNTPLNWTKDSRFFHRVGSHPVPMMKLAGQGEEFDKRIARWYKKDTRQMKDLKKQLQFHEESNLVAMLDFLAVFHDDRMSQVAGCRPFRDDPNKRQFYKSLLESGLAHCTVQNLNGFWISANMGFPPDRVGSPYHSGMEVWNPHYARLSPARGHSLKLARMLCGKYSDLDLSPGGADGYKGELASHFIQCNSLDVFFRFHQYAKHQIARKTSSMGARILRSVGISPFRIKNLFRKGKTG